MYLFPPQARRETRRIRRERTKLLVRRRWSPVPRVQEEEASVIKRKEAQSKEKEDLQVSQHSPGAMSQRRS